MCELVCAVTRRHLAKSTFLFKMAGEVITLEEIEKINRNIGSVPVATIKTLHKLIFETEPSDRKNRRRLRNFSGFKFERDSSEHEKKLTFIHEEFSEADLIAV